MKTIVLNGNQEIIDAFRGFVPKEYSHYLGDEQALLFGECEAEDDGIAACGITILVPAGRELVIKWMWMDPSYRMKSGGSNMLEAVFETAAENGFTRVSAHVPLDEEGDEDGSMLGDFFYDAGFTENGTAKQGGIAVKKLTLRTAEYERMENNRLNAEVSAERIERAYKKFPKNYKVVDVEYFSGIPVEE